VLPLAFSTLRALILIVRLPDTRLAAPGGHTFSILASTVAHNLRSNRLACLIPLPQFEMIIRHNESAASVIGERLASTGRSLFGRDQ
jgi:hypothetical protein